MSFGTFHKGKKRLINKIKINILSFFIRRKNPCKDVQKKIRTCLLIHDNNKIGDLIVLSGLYRELSKRNVELYVITNHTGNALLNHSNKIKKVIVKESNSLKDMLRVIKNAREHYFDIVIDPFETMPSFKHALLLSNLKTDNILGFDRWYKRYYTFYHLHDENLKEHMSTRTCEILSHMYEDGKKADAQRYELAISDTIEKEINSYIAGSNVVIVNPLGAKKICRLTEIQIKIIYHWIQNNHPELRIIFTGHPDDVSLLNAHGVETFSHSEFLYTVALTKMCHYVISVDTALVHIASAFEKPTLALYPNSRTESYPSHKIWSPNNPNAIQVISPTYTVVDINSEDIIANLERLFLK